MIRIQGARTHNLKGFDIDLPRDKLIVITGLSGSGKSSLAFDTIYAEGQRRYVESLSSYARQFLSTMDKPDVEHIEGLSPAISIEQKSTSHNPRSTVGTITEIHDYLRLLFARAGTPYCPTHQLALDSQTVSQMVDAVMELPEGAKLMMLAPIVQNRKGEHVKLLEDVKRQGFVRLRIDGVIYDIEETPELEKNKKHTIEIVVDRFKIREDLKQRLAESFETSLHYNTIVKIAYMDDGAGDDLVFSSKFACSECGYSLEELEPRMFSFNNPTGACPTCDGLGIEARFDPKKIVAHPYLAISTGAIRGWDKNARYYFKKMQSLAEHYKFSLDDPFEELQETIQNIVLYGSGDTDIEMVYVTDKGREFHSVEPFEGVIPNIERRYKETESNYVREELSKYQNNQKCSSCKGTRLNEGSRNVLIDDANLPKVSALSITDCFDFFDKLQLQGAKAEIADKILKEINQRLSFLINVGLNYLSLERSADTLSGGEAQRIRLASQIGAGLVGVMYVLDEPSIGLHQRDNDRLLKSLFHLRDLGNTVIVVEHDEDAIRCADHVVDIGPGAGVHGGEVVAEGTPQEIMNNENSLTGKYLQGIEKIEIPKRVKPSDDWLNITGAEGNNLKKVDISVPVGLFTCITGVSGSGKSTLINETLSKAMYQALERVTDDPAKFAEISGTEHFDKIINIDQSPIGRTPRSNPATYTQIFTAIRELFSGTEESRARGYTPGRFSFNVKGGRCEACQGDGVIKVEMHFLADVYVKCDICKGKKYNRETLDVQYKGKNVYEVLQMTVEDALRFFEAIPAVNRKLQTLMDVGLSYITLGQNAVTLSGGEAQRIKLSKELSKRDTGKTLYILDEPTTGLHFHDVKQLLSVIHRLRDQGNTLIVIEHNLDVIKTCDWIVDLGPDGGNGGGEIVATGTPETVAKSKKGYTGKFLKEMLG